MFENQIINGNCLGIMKEINDETIHLCFTSPPYYNTKSYSRYATYDLYLEFLRDVFKEVHRITKEGRFFVLNISPVITPRLSRSHQSTRHPIPFDLHPLLQDIGWEFIDDIIWVKPEASVKNRNGIFSQCRKPLTYKPNIITEYLLVYRKKTDKLIDWNLKQYDKSIIEQSKILDDYETNNIWYIHPKANKLHPAVFPDELAEKVIKYYSFMGDLVFDPFLGSGTTCKVAKKLNRNYFGIELNKEYFETIKI